jgi:hypothetical protein
MPFTITGRQFRMLSPTPGTKVTAPRGQVHDGSAGYLTVAAHDADMLRANGWTLVAEIGATGSRPVSGVASDVPGVVITLSAGDRYFDTTLGKMIYWHAQKRAWVDETNTLV